MSTAEGGDVVHAYGLVEPGATLALSKGIAGSKVTTVTADRIAALVSRLDADAFGPDAWRAHAEDPRWLEHVAREHHAVLQAVVEQTDVLPLRLPGIHQDLATLERVLREQQSTLAAALEQVRGHVEMGAKIFLMDQGSSAPDEQRPTSGRDYLARRSAQASDREQARARRQSHVSDGHEAMVQGSTRSTVNAPQDAALSGRAEPMLLNAAYLVPRADFEGFLALAERLNQGLVRDGMALEITGPWPPYNFADLPDTAAAGRRPQ